MAPLFFFESALPLPLWHILLCLHLEREGEPQSVSDFETVQEAASWGLRALAHLLVLHPP